MVQMKGKDRRHPWLGSTTWLLVALFLLFGLYWFVNREPTSIVLKYGELMQVLQAQDPGVRLQNVKVTRTEIRGDIVTTDQVSDGSGKAERHVQVKPFRTPRVGLEADT